MVVTVCSNKSILEVVSALLMVGSRGRLCGDCGSDGLRGGDAGGAEGRCGGGDAGRRREVCR